MAATITRPSASVARNTLQTIPWAGITAPVHATTRSDWFGLFVATTALDSEPTLWQLTDGSATGSGALYLPPDLAGITYELRLFSGHTNAKLATSATFAVTAGTAPTVTAPATASANDVISVSWSGIGDPQPSDWLQLELTVGAQGVPYSAAVPTGGAAAGSASLYIPNATPANTYHVVVYRAAIPAYGLAAKGLTASSDITVTTDALVAVLNPGDQLAGALVSVTWAGLVAPAPSNLDWTGLFAPGAPAANPLAWRYLSGAPSGSLPFQIPDNLGTASYELRLYSGADQSLLATSPSFTITAVA